MASACLRRLRLSPTLVPFLHTLRHPRPPARIVSRFMSIHPSDGRPQSPTNRLANERSPYLQEHKHNPVEWYPWGEEAFKQAREQDKPIFLSIGYSTCHWCHVMNKESFESEETARIMNEHFINVKVDREERPNVDKLYMTFVQSTTGHGGWPMSVFLTPDLKPFFGGTYFPPVEAYHTPAFTTVLHYLSDKWETNRQALLNSGEEVAKFLRNVAKHSASSEDTPIDASGTMEKLYNHYTGIFDQENGGLGGAPKFPTPPTLYFLSRFYAANHNLPPPPILDFSPEADAEDQHRDRRRDKAERSADMVCHTLRNVALGGIHDHLGGGFHRYSVDAAWHVPHFEKMIYDQAQLLNCYLEAYSITGDEHMANAAKDIVSYLERDMTHPKGGFYSAQDADSLPSPTSLHKVEGAYYVWTKKEIEDVLRSARDVDIFCHHFGVREEGNVDKIYDPHGELEGKNILTLRHTLNAPTTDRFNISTHKVETFLAEYKRILLSHRQRTRPAPHRDDKIITGWNGLAISALSRAGLHLQSSTCLDMATRAAEFAHGQLWDKRRKRLRRCYYDEDGGGIDGFADDYANMIRACLDLHEVGWDEKWVEWAAEMQQVMVDVFEDQESGGFFGEAADVGTKADGVGSIARLKDDHDGAEPAANAVTVSNLVRLSKLLDNTTYARLAERTVRAFYPQVKQYPQIMPSMVAELAWVRDGGRQVIFQIPPTTNANQPISEDQLTHLRSTHFLPFTTFIRAPHTGSSFVGARNATVKVITECGVPERLRVYACESGVCREPVEDEELVESAVLGIKKSDFTC